MNLPTDPVRAECLLRRREEAWELLLEGAEDMPLMYASNPLLSQLWKEVEDEFDTYKVKEEYRFLTSLGKPLPDPAGEWEVELQKEFWEDQRQTLLEELMQNLIDGHFVADPPENSPLWEPVQQAKKEFEAFQEKADDDFVAALTEMFLVCMRKDAAPPIECDCNEPDCLIDTAADRAEEKFTREEYPQITPIRDFLTSPAATNFPEEFKNFFWEFILAQPCDIPECLHCSPAIN